MPPRTNRNEPHPARLDEAVKTRRERRAGRKEASERSVGQNLAMIGTLGLTIVIPTLIGVFAGRWLDHSFDSGVHWTLGLLVAGLAAGCWLAWTKIRTDA